MAPRGPGRLAAGESLIYDIVGAFRALLARFGFHYMAVQLYAGFARRVLTQQGRTYSCVIHTSNDHWTCNWLKVYARVHAT